MTKGRGETLQSPLLPFPFLPFCLWLIDNNLEQIYTNSTHGVVAQLGERTVRNGEVAGSTPVNSTI
jgi:hypothetical protein